MKRTFEIMKKLLICALIILILNNFFIGNFIQVSYATDTDTVPDPETSEENQDPNENNEDSTGATPESILENILGTVVGLLTWPLRIVALAVGMGVNGLIGVVASIEGKVEDIPDANGEGSAQLISPFHILFNKVDLLKINFFKAENENTAVLYKFRTGIAFWYYAMRNIAAAILLCVLIYVGIRMALSTVSAQQKASYKKMLVDWVVSLAIIFILQYIILFTIYVNDSIVDAIANIGNSKDGIDKVGTIMNELAWNSLGITSDGIVATIVYCMLVFQTFGLFVSYFNRMLKLAFLIIISPLITLTYSIDKMGDGKAQALNTWLKEYVFTILIQPFHCIIYMVFITSALDLIGQDGWEVNSIAAGIIAVLCINFTREGEKIVRKIFAFADDSEHTSLAAGMAVAAVAASKGKNVGKTTRKAITGVKDAGIRAKNLLKTGKVEAIALARMARGKGEGKTFSEVKSEVRTDQYNRQAERRENRRYGVNSMSKEDIDKMKDGPEKKLLQNISAEINKRADAYKQNGMSANEAKARARAEVAKEVRKARKKSKFSQDHKVISKARGTVGKVKSTLQQSETLRELGNFMKISTAAGAGLAFGAGVYGSSGNFSQGVLTGVGAYRGTQEFMKNSTGTLKSDILSRLSGLGTSGRTEAFGKLNSIAMNGNKYEGSDELDKIMQELEEALKLAGIDGKVKTNIRNTIQKSIATNPSQDIGTVVNNALATNGISGDAGILSAATNLATFTQEKGIYDTIKQAGDIGLSPDAFISSVARSYHGSSNSSEYAEGYESDRSLLNAAVNSTNSSAPDIDEERLRDFVETRNERDLQAFYEECNLNIENLREQMDDSSSDEKEKQQREIDQIELTKARVQDLELQRVEAKLKERYDEAMARLADARSRLATDQEKQAKKEVKRIVNKELARLQGDYDKYISQANSVIEREGQNGIRAKKEIEDQKDRLRAVKGQIEARRKKK